MEAAHEMSAEFLGGGRLQFQPVSERRSDAVLLKEGLTRQLHLGNAVGGLLRASIWKKLA